VRSGREIHPIAYPDGDVRSDDFRVVEAVVREPGPGEVVVRNTWTSVDAALRLRLREHAPEGYFGAFALGAPMDGILTVGEVVDSRAEGFEVGDTVRHAFGWRDYAVVRAGEAGLAGVGTLMQVDPELAPPRAYLGLLGGSGLPAYVGLFEIASLEEDDVVWVSAAAGSVGSLAAQIAKINGNRVIGSAGSDDKVAFLRDELGLDAAFNYRAGPLPELLREAAPDGIDVYFDNVGGDHLEAAIGALRNHGRIVACGSISRYNDAEPTPAPRNLFMVVTKRLLMQGFIINDHYGEFSQFLAAASEWFRDGRLRYRETLVDGIQNAPKAFLGLLRGENIGKMLVKVGPDE
jgi:NADPH-dependent curcumin reductase CurA